MTRKPRNEIQSKSASQASAAEYDRLFGGISEVLESARRASARAVNAIMTATYWEIGRRIVEFEQKGEKRAVYGEELIEKLSADLSSHFGRGFGVVNLSQMKKFYLLYPPERIFQTVSEESASESNKGIGQTPSGILRPLTSVSSLVDLARSFPLPWSAYVRLLSVKNEHAREFYETEALRDGWSVRQLDRQINSQFYERIALSKNKAAMLTRGQKTRPEDIVQPEEEIKDPVILEFLGLKDEYSETDLENALIRHLESFLLELGGDFCFIGRQKRLRIGDDWYRVDLLFFHRRLRCLVIIDLKLGKFTHADVGQMHLYLNYAREHWTQQEENPPIGLILCAQKNEALVHYTLDNLPNKVLAAEYETVLPDEKVIAEELERTRRMLESKTGHKKPRKRKSNAKKTRVGNPA